jgi:outer membrane protein TolC
MTRWSKRQWNSRPDLKQLRADIDEAERNVKLAQNRVLPDLNLIVNYGQVYSTDPLLDPESVNDAATVGGVSASLH